MKQKLLTLILIFSCLFIPARSYAQQPGDLDASFTSAVPALIIDGVAIQPDGKILIGYYVNNSGTVTRNIARLNANGTVDTTFNTGTGVNNDILAIAPLPDGKILIGGFFTTFNGQSRIRIARLNANGSIDTGFNAGSLGPNNSVNTIHVQTDGKLLITGAFSNIDGVARRLVARLNANGSVDSSFNGGTQANYTFDAVVLQPDGKLIVGGTFDRLNNVDRMRIARYNTDGSIDASFDPGNGPGAASVNALALQSDNKIIVGGSFTTFNNVPQVRIARLNTDGTLDTTFNPGVSANAVIRSIALQADGKMIIAGDFTTFNGVSRNHIARLNADGSLDTTFNPGTGTDERLETIILQPDGNLIIKGDFNTYNGTSKSLIARVYTGNTSPCTTAAPTASSQTFCNSGTVAGLTATGTDLKWYGAATGGTVLPSATSLATGTYYVSQTVSGCESPRTEVSITVTPNVTPSVTIVSSEIQHNESNNTNYVCAGSSVTFTATAVNAGITPTYQWLVNNQVQAGETGSTFTRTFQSLAQVRCRITVSPGNCTTQTTAQSTITIVDPAAVPVATIAAQGPLSFCEGGNVVLQANGQIDTNSRWLRNGEIYANVVPNNSSITVTQPGNYTLLINGYSGYNCTAISAPAVVTVNSIPAAPVAQSQSHCAGSLVSDLTSQGNNIKWYPSQAATVALSATTVLETGTYYASQTINSCESVRTAVLVTITPATTPLVTIVQSTGSEFVCSNENSLVSFNAYTQDAGTNPGYEWLVNGVVQQGYTGSSFSYAPAANAVISARITISPELTCYSNTTAESNTMPITMVSANAQITITGNTTFCLGGSVLLQGIGIGENDYAAWIKDGEYYDLAYSNTPLTITESGNYLLEVYSEYGCFADSEIVTVTVTSTPAPTATAQSYCGGTTVAGLIATGTAVKWYAIASGGTALGSTATLATRTYYASQTINGCESTRTAVAVTINTTALPTAAAQSFCNGATIANITATGTNLQWYATATGGSALNADTILTTGNYYATQTLNGCESARRTVNITIATPPAPIAQEQNFCNNATVNNLTATGTLIKWYASQNGGTVLLSSTVLATGTYYASQTINGCESERIAVGVTITNTPLPTVQPQSFCFGTTVSSLTAVGNNIQWYAAETGGNPLAGTTLLTATTYYASQTINGCQSLRAASVVTLLQPADPTVSVRSNDLSYNAGSGIYTVCGGSAVTFEALAGNAGTNPTYQWYVNGALQPGHNSSLYTAVLPNTGYLFVSVRLTVGTGSCTNNPIIESDELLIDLIDAPYVEIIPQGPTTFCQGGSVVLQAAGAENYEGVWLRNGEIYDYVVSGYNDFLEVSLPGVYVLEIVSNDGCSGTSAPITVIETTPVTPAVSLTSSAAGAIAQGTAVTFTATPTHGGSAPYYDFKVNGSTMQSGTSSTYTTSTLYNGNVVTVQLTSNAACATAQVAVSNGVTITVNTPGTVNPEPGSGGILYVRKGATGNGASWTDALGEVALALKYAKQTNDATPGTVSQIWVAGGTYTPMYSPVDLNGDSPQARNNSFLLVNNVQLYGGFAGIEASPLQRDLTLAANASILSGDFLGNDNGTINNIENAYHIVLAIGTAAIPVTSATVLDGFTITGAVGNASGVVTVNSIGVSNTNGGAIYMANASPSLRNLIIKGNRVNTNGGGTYGASSQPSLTNVLIINNTANNGGGMYNLSSAPVLTNVTLCANTATTSGGALFNASSSPKVRNSIIYGNATGVTNSGTLSNPEYAYSLVQGLSSTANGNVDGSISPLFTNADAGDYTFAMASPALNSGSNSYYAIGALPNLNSTTKDLGGYQRIYNGGTVDMGAYEFQQDCAIATTWNGSAWSNGKPTSYIHTATIAGNYNAGSITACSLVITNGAVTLLPGHTFNIKGAVNVNAGASITIENNAALVQHDDTVNTGATTVIKASNPLYRLDYTLWSSPVAGQNLLTFSPETLTNRFYEYKYALNTTSNSYVEQYFTLNPAALSFEPAKGYLIRMPNGNNLPGYNDGTAALTYTGTFNGVAHNGTVTRTASIEGDRYTAVGNPYPSPISIADFFRGNMQVMDGSSALYFWRKRNDAASSSYAALNLTGYTANPSRDGGNEQAAFYNGLSSNWLIAQGQGFIVRTQQNPSASAITFANSMRRAVPVNGNQGFFRSANTTTATADEGMSRYWINLSGTAGANSQTLVGYMPDATLGLDYGYDGRQLNDGGRSSIFTIVEGTPLAIQARPSFTPDDVVTMGFTAAVAGEFAISLDHMDGLFEQGQDIFIRDNQQDLTHNLNDGPYTFTSGQGTFSERFEVVYIPAALGANNPTLTPNNVIAYKEGSTVTINSGTVVMNSITIYDIRGRKIYQKDAINAAQTTISGLQIEQQVIILEINTDKGSVSKRIIF
jgi:uncharacterized delta-60 repeat protein